MRQPADSGPDATGLRVGQACPMVDQTSAVLSIAVRVLQAFTPDDEYLNAAKASGHEHTDANVWLIVQFAIWLAASALVTLAVVLVLFLAAPLRSSVGLGFPRALHATSSGPW